MKKVLFFIASVAIIVLFFSSCKKTEVATLITPPTGPADVLITQLPSPDPTTANGNTLFTITLQVEAKNKDAYLPKTVTPFNVQADDAGGIGAIVKAEGYETFAVMSNIAADPAEVTAEGATDKTSAFLIKANTKCKIMVKKVVTDSRGIRGKFAYELVDFKTFSNFALTEGKIHKLLGFATSTINL